MKKANNLEFTFEMELEYSCAKERNYHLFIE